ncbi:MAG: hypothetical protein OXB93_05030 [Cytophagales bacterium]|nr:hypothetical protein [Cytophagales bacterium]
MNLLQTHATRLMGLSVAVPQHRVSNERLPQLSPTECQELITYVGIRYRHLSQKQTLSDLLRPAVQQLLKKCSVPAQEVGLLVLITQTGDQQVPNTAIGLQHILDLPTSALCIEINMGCAGYVYGLYLVSLLLQSLESSYALFLNGDISTLLVKEHNKGVLPIFSDAVSATLLTKDEKAEPWSFCLNNDGKDREAIRMISPNWEDPWAFYPHASLHVDGTVILSFALRQVAQQVRSFMHKTSCSEQSVDYFIFHQANRIINESLRTKLNIPAHKYPYSLYHFGNTSSATIPLTMASELSVPLSTRSSDLLLCGFGAGLSWATALLPKTPPFEILPIHHV